MTDQIDMIVDTLPRDARSSIKNDRIDDIERMVGLFPAGVGRSISDDEAARFLKAAGRMN